MTRREFLSELYHRLGTKMSREEAEQYLTYYAEMLADRVEEGMTEEEAVAGMEDVDTIAGRILQERAEENAAPGPEPRPAGEEPAAEPPREGEQPAWSPRRKRPGWVIPAAVIAGVLLLAAVGCVIPRMVWREVVTEPAISLGPDGIRVDNGGKSVTIGPDGIQVTEYGETTASISPNGIEVTEDSETTASISPNGIEVTEDSETTASISPNGIEVTEDGETTFYNGPGDIWGGSGQDAEVGDGYAIDGEYAVSPENIQKIEVDWVSGGVRVEAWDGAEIAFSEASRAALNDDTRLFYETGGGTLSIRYAKGRVRDLKGGKLLVIQVPRALAESMTKLAIGTTSADVDLYGVSAGTLEINTTSGDVSVPDGTFSNAELSTTSGEMILAGDAEKVEMFSTSGDMNLTGGGALRKAEVSTVSGEMLVTLPEDQGFTLQWDTISGDLDTGSRAVTLNGEEYTYGDGAVDLRFSSVSGGLRLA